MKSSERCLLLTIHRHQYVSYQHGQLQITDHLSVTYSQCCIFVLLGPSAVYSQSCYQFQFMAGDYDKLLVNIGGDHLEKGINTNFISVSIRYAVLCQSLPGKTKVVESLCSATWQSESETACTKFSVWPQWESPSGRLWYYSLQHTMAYISCVINAHHSVCLRTFFASLIVSSTSFPDGFL